MTALAFAALAILSQIPPELRGNPNEAKAIDPAIPPGLYEVLIQASEAELDPKRGPGNAVEVLKAAKEKQVSTDLKLSLDLRIAATVLRARFAKDPRLSEADRPARALSTFSKLDVAEPGIAPWLERTIAAQPAPIKAALTDPKLRRIKVNASVTGATIDPATLVTSLAARMKPLGLEIVRAPAAEADVSLRVTALEVRDQGGKAFLRASLDLAGLKGKDPRWKKSLFRSVTAPDAKIALEAADDWLIRIGGRDLLFQWLSERGLLSSALPQAPQMPGHAHDDDHDHPSVSVAPSVSLPEGGKQPGGAK